MSTLPYDRDTPTEASPIERRFEIVRQLRKSESRAPLVEVMGLSYNGLGALAFESILDGAVDHCREHLGREPEHDEAMEVVGAIYTLLNAPAVSTGRLDLRDPIYVGWARIAAAIAYRASEEIGWNGHLTRRFGGREHA